ncbi:uncharacterized protein [Typha latifolia]|uniref:uncharacterized protein n=1 Tax=Typha latifolia TaxID=4733 RepID=UPI003C2CE77F
MLLRAPPYPNVLHHHLLILSSRLHLSAFDGVNPSLVPSDLWVAKAFSTAYLLSPSSPDRLASFRGVLSPSVAFEAIRRIQNPNFALGLFELARSSFEISHSVDSYRFLVGFLCRSGLQNYALKMFDEMIDEGHCPDSSFLEFLVSTCAEAGILDCAMELITRTAELGCCIETYTFNKVMSLLVGRNRAHDAVALFKGQLGSGCFTPDGWSFNIVIKGLCKLGDVEEAFKFIEKMGSFGCSPDTVTHNILVDGLCRAGEVERGHEILRRIEKDGFCVPNVVTYTSLISGYCKMGKMEEASVVFRDMIGFGVKPSRVTYNVLIDGYGKVNDMQSAVSVYNQMETCACTPDVVTLTSLIDGYCRSGQLDDAMKLWNEMEHRELQPNVYTFAIMINSLCKKNRLDEAQVLLKKLSLRRDIVPHAFIYNPVIDGLCKVGNVDEANAILVEMEGKRCFPDKYTYTILIIGHCMKGRMTEAIALFHKMVATGCAPDDVTVGCLVSCLLRAGMPSEVNRIMLISSRNIS